MSLKSWLLKFTTWTGGSENPNNPIDDDCAGGMFCPTTSSIFIDQQIAMTYPALFRGVSLVAGKVATLPIHVYERKNDGESDRTARYDHPVYSLLNKTVASDMKSFDFVESMQGVAGLRGNAYALIYRINAGIPYELQPIRPDRVRMVRENGKTTYQIDIDGEISAFLPKNILHIRGFGLGRKGIDLIEYGAETIGLGIAMRTYNSQFFQNNATPPTVLEHPNKLSPQARRQLREDWEAMHKGLNNSHRVAVLQEGMKANKLGTNAKDAQLLEARAFELKDIANLTGVPGHKLGDDSKTSYSSLEQENQAFLDDCLNRWLKQWETECNWKLFREDEQKRLYCEFVREALIQVDIQSLTDSLIDQLNNGLINLDEARAKINMPPIPNGEGQKFRRPLNIGFVGEPTEEEEPDEEDDEDDDERSADPVIENVTRQLLQQGIERIVKRISKQAERASHDSKKFWAYIHEFEEKNAETCRGILDMACRMVEIDAKTMVSGLFEGFREHLLLASECQKADLRSSVDEVLESWKQLPEQTIKEIFDGNETVIHP